MTGDIPPTSWDSSRSPFTLRKHAGQTLTQRPAAAPCSTTAGLRFCTSSRERHTWHFNIIARVDLADQPARHWVAEPHPRTPPHHAPRGAGLLLQQRPVSSPRPFAFCHVGQPPGRSHQSVSRARRPGRLPSIFRRSVWPCRRVSHSATDAIRRLTATPELFRGNAPKLSRTATRPVVSDHPRPLRRCLFGVPCGTHGRPCRASADALRPVLLASLEIAPGGREGCALARGLVRGSGDEIS